MRKISVINDGWYFQRADIGIAQTIAEGKTVNLPHTWNATDGQDGGNDYYRGKCWYVKKLDLSAYAGMDVWLQIEAAAMTALLTAAAIFLTCRPLSLAPGAR